MGSVACLIRKVVVPAARLGTRLFLATEEQSKEMIPIFVYMHYVKPRTSKIVWIRQPEPKGFGDAVSLAQPFMQNESLPFSCR